MIVTLKTLPYLNLQEKIVVFIILVKHISDNITIYKYKFFNLQPCKYL